MGRSQETFGKKDKEKKRLKKREEKQRKKEERKANAVKGKMGPMASVKGVIHCGLALTFILYLAFKFIA